MTWMWGDSNKCLITLNNKDTTDPTRYNCNVLKSSIPIPLGEVLKRKLFPCTKYCCLPYKFQAQRRKNSLHYTCLLPPYLDKHCNAPYETHSTTGGI